MPATRLARNPSLLDSNLQWLAAEAPQFHTQSSSSYYTSHHDEDASGTDDDASGSDSEDDPYHPYNLAEPQQRWVSNGQFVYDAEQLQEGLLASEHDHVLISDDPIVQKVEDKDLSPLLHLGPTVDFPAHPDPFLHPYTLGQPVYPQHFQYSQQPQEQLPQTVSPLDISRPLPEVHAPAVVPDPTPVFASAPRTRTTRRLQPTRTLVTRSSARAKAMKNSPAEGVDVDAEGEDDDDFLFESDADSEDEYVDPCASGRKPKTRRGASTQTRYRYRLSASPYPSSSRSSSAVSYASSPASGRSRPGSRNRQVWDSPPPRRGQGWNKPGDKPWECKYCDHIQANKRAPDMERHVLSHFRDQMQAQWVCCGVPVEEASEYDVDPNQNKWTFKGRDMVGGCHETFSRMDALKRHWNNPNVTCKGDTQYSRPGDD